MELRHLRYFAVLSETLNFTEAARRVHVTQPTLSHQIKQLEAELGRTLLDRGGRRTRLTRAGELFLPKVLEALDSIDSGTALLQDADTELEGHIRLATSQTFNIAIVPRAVSTFKQENPSVRVTVDELTHDEMMDGLRRDHLDLAISYQPPDSSDLRYERLCDEELVLITRADHPLAERRRVRMIELHGLDMLLLSPRFMTRQVLDKAFAAAGTEPRAAIESGTIASLLTLVRETGLPTILSRYAVPHHSGLRAVSLESPCPIRATGLIWKRSRLRLSTETLFAVGLRAATEELAAGRSGRVGKRGKREDIPAQSHL